MKQSTMVFVNQGMGKIELIVVLVSTATIAFVAYRLREAEGSIARVQKENKNLNEELREEKNSIAKLQKDNKNLNKIVREAEHAITRLQKDNKNLNEEVIGAKDSLAIFHKETENLNEAVREAKDSLAKLQKDNTNLKEEVKLLLSDSRTVGFHAVLSKDLNLGSSQTVVFDQIISNIGDSYNSHSGSFTVPFNGVYYLTSTFLSRWDKTQLHLQMVKNDAEISRGYSSTPGSHTGSMSAVVSLKRGDVVKVQHMSGLGSQTIHGSYSFFTGYPLP